MKSKDKFVLVLVASLSLLLAGCGGGGSSSSPDPEPMAMTCPAGQTGTPPNCMDPEPSEPMQTQAEIEGLTEAIADPDGDGKFPESDELATNRRPGEDMTFGPKGVITVGSDRLGMNDITVNNAVEFDEDSETRLSIGSLKSSAFMRTKDSKTDTLTIYSDLKAAKNQAWNEYYEAGTTVDGVDAVAPTGVAPPAGTTRYNTLSLSAGAVSAELLGRVEGLTIGTTLESGADNAVSGTFHGVPGKYTCTADCVLTQSNSGAVTLTGGPLIFTPSNTKDDTDDSHMIAGAIPDSDYLAFGYWVQTMAMGSGTKYGVGTFAGGNDRYGQASDGSFTATVLDSIDGTATYEGSATGMYARKDLAVVDGAVVGTPAEAGQFSADVSLTAHFGNDADPAVNGSDKISAAEAFTISGMVDNFRNAEGAISNWSLSLNSAPMRAGASDAYTGEFSGETGKGDLIGRWTGSFYGPDANDAFPTGTAGEFTGHFSNGHVVGAFGATKQQ